MGVSGLFSYIRNDPGNFKPYKLHNTRAVFDGMNILHFIYRRSSFTVSFNGEYLAFDVAVEQFIENFRKCKVEPIFVFDGVHEISKLATIIKRGKEKLEKASAFQLNASKLINGFSTDTDKDPKPPSLQRSFLDSLDRLNVSHITGDRESDQLAVALAIQLKCPIISNDSDFFIMRPYWGNVEGFEYLQFDRINMHPCQISHFCPNATVCFCMNCDRFCPEAGSFRSLSAIQLPLFATLCGNNYIPTNYFNRYIPCWRSKPDLQNPRRFNDKIQRMQTLIQWLSGFGSDISRAVDQVLESFSPPERAVATNYLLTSLASYALNTSDNTYLDILGISGTCTGNATTFTSFATIGAKAAAILNDREGIFAKAIDIKANWPLDLVNAYCETRFSSYFCEVFFSGAFVTDAAGIEDVLSRKSSYDCALPLRRLIYCLLLTLEFHEIRRLPGVQATSNGFIVTEIARSGASRFQKYSIELSPIVSSTTILKDHLHIQSFSQNPIDHALISLFFTWMRLDDKPPSKSFSSSCIGLAVCLCAFAAGLLQTNLSRQNLLSRFNICRREVEGGLTGTNLRVDFLHAISQLQEIYKTMCTLTAILTALNGIACDLQFPPLPIVFPSGHLAHQLAQQLSLVVEKDRLPVLLRDWLPCIFGKSSSNENEKQRFKTIVECIDKMLVSTPESILPKFKAVLLAVGGIDDIIRQAL